MDPVVVSGGFTPNRLILCPEPGILFTRANAAWAYHALKSVREAGISIPEQDELCEELARLLFPPQPPGEAAPPLPPEPETCPGCGNSRDQQGRIAHKLSCPVLRQRT